MFLEQAALGAEIAQDIYSSRTYKSSSIYIAVSMLGATVMPHVIYLHSALVLPRREARDRRRSSSPAAWNCWTCLLAMNGAWLINSAMLIMAAAVFFGHGMSVYSIEAAHGTLAPLLGRFAGVAFGSRLLASGLSSSSVGTMAGQVILQGFLNIRISIFLAPRRDDDSGDSGDRLGARSAEDTDFESGGSEFLPAVCDDSASDS